MCSRKGSAVLTSVEGVFRNGRVELVELPRDVREETPVIVTFIETGGIDLRSRGIDAAAAARLRGTLATFAEDWESPEMEIYDDFTSARASGS